MAEAVPAGFHSVTPRLVVHDPAGLVEFLRYAFGGSGDSIRDSPSQIKIGDSIVMVSGVGPRDARPYFLYLYVEDVGAAYQRALDAGAVSLEVPADLPYGDRRAIVRDPGANDWQIAARSGVPMLRSVARHFTYRSLGHTETLIGSTALVHCELS